ncbi:phosphatase PAP2 family protein [Sphingobium estronivorans]|uniref:phosphatase PAP2 family protein n=1 Tax=Sphingobium estronivorans TaxID=1577690 RepID=UPI001F081994|nr:phosphatase PAP2 family protein [Sphingobium estronivorans]
MRLSNSLVLLLPALVLPNPPAEGSPEQTLELKQLHDIEASRTAAEFAHADADFKLKNVTVFAEAMGPGFDLARLPETKALFDTLQAEEKASANRAKDHFKRNRPWIVDQSLHGCSTDDPPQSSYPSGHVTMGFAMATVLARLAPRRAPAIMARAADYARSRLVCAMHFQTDVTAGEIWGTMIGERLMQQPGFLAQFGRAKAELISAGVAAQ